MSHDRYLYICSILHTGKDSEKDYNKPPLWKCSKMIDLVNANFVSSYYLDAEVSIDMLFKGHHSLFRYIPKQKFGFKIYALACSTNGNVYRFLFDLGSIKNKN